MIKFIFSRLIHSFLVMFAISFIAFFIMFKAGDPIQLLLPADATQQAVIEMRHTLGLDRSFFVQYKSFLIQLSQGNLGNSFVYGEPALDIVLERLPATLELAILAMMISILLGIPLGIIASINPNSMISKVIICYNNNMVDMSQVFKAKVRKIGNSYGVLIPVEIIEELHVDKGDELTISVATSDLEERNRILMEIAGIYEGKKPFKREKEDRY